MTTEELVNILLNRGQTLWQDKQTFVRFTGDPRADEMLNDLTNTPHAFVLACIINRQMKAELAWRIPFQVAQKLGDFDMSALVELDLSQIEDLMTQPEPLHRFPFEMAKNFYEGVQRIATVYQGKASNIWVDEPSSATVVYRFLEFRGVGPKIATMATNILARDFKVVFSDYYSIDVSVDTHIRRVFTRLGLVPKGASTEQIIYRARSLSPEFPGLLDLPAWEIGRNWCKPREPECTVCYMDKVCLRQGVHQ
ncbi:MAG: iron-sulfur cluster loop [Chloroflexi bacterium]|nr:MAG: iron-sulfur cluster loop [Chloroflexota bacterium]